MSEPALKILIIGPSNVGKSALLKRYCDDDFDPNDATATIGIDFRVKRLSVHGKTYRVTLLDTAGQERFRTLSTSYYRGAHGIVFVYDLTNRATFAQMDAWFAEAVANTALASPPFAASSQTPVCQFCLVAAKSDRADATRAVTTDEGRALARQHNPDPAREPLFFETSARSGDNVRAPFVALVDRIVAAGVPGTGRSSNATVSLGAAANADGWSSYVPGCSC